MAADKSELRQLAPNHLLQALDAIAMAKGMERHPSATSEQYEAAMKALAKQFKV